MKNVHWVGSFLTPVGSASAVVDEDGRLKRFHFGRLDASGLRSDRKAIAHIRDQVEAYFARDRRDFALPLAPDGTAFQQQVWEGLLTIPYGEIMSYGGLAVQVGHPAASRAVGAANGQNPIALIIPCHRVVGHDRTLTGYGGGIAVKAKLLAHEGVLAPELVRGAHARTRIEPAVLI
ncbi:MAG TPA: methylated-DNA--[protein]-cysteine S-methyltransferase [Alphaproteobacteria bacterium]|nr:methylated-DNA--[protein]-cysteine S-methyltransferase [Alphaproteobacteria bacterium]